MRSLLHNLTVVFSLSAWSSRRLIAGLLVAMAMASAATAQTTATWYGSGTSAVGGTGTWNTTLTNWSSDGSSWFAWNNTTNSTSTAVFAGTSGTVTLGVNITAGGLQFDTTGYVISGNNTLTLGNTSTQMTVASGMTATISSTLAGTGGLTKSGAGTLTLGASNVINTYSGGTIVNGGTLTLGSNSSSANGTIRGSLTINTGATVNANAGGWSLGYGGTRPGGFAGNSVTSITINGGLLNFSNASSGGGLAASQITLTGGTIGGVSFGWINSNTLTPTLQTLASSARSTLSGGISLRLSGSGTLTFDVASGSTSDGIDLAVSGPITNSTQPDNVGGSLVKTGAGRMVLSGTNTFTGGLSLAAGQLDLNSATALGTGTFTITGGTIGNSSGASVTLTNNNVQAWNGDFAFVGPSSLSLGTGVISLNGNRTVTVTTGTLTAGGGIAGAGFGLMKAGNGALILTGSSTYTGTTNIGAGTLQIGSSSAAGSLSTSSVITGSAGATLAFNRNDAISQGVAFASAISGGLGLTQAGSGTVTLAAGNTYGGATQVNAGVLVLGEANALSGSTAVTVAGGELRMGANSNSVGSFTISSGSLTGSGGKLTAATYGLGGGTVTANLGSGTVNVTASSNLNGTSDATTLNLNAGTLTLGGGGGRFAVHAVAVSGSSGASLVLGGNETIGSLAGSANINLGSATLTTGSANTSTTYSGILSGSGGLTKVGGGTLTLGNVTNSYTGGTIVDGGTLTLGNGAANGNIRGSLTINAGATVNASANGWSLGFGGTRSGAQYSGNSVTSIAINGGLLNFTTESSGAGLAANQITLAGGTIGGGSFGWINSNTLTPTLQTLASSARSTLSGGISLRVGTSGTLTFEVASGSTSDGIDLAVTGPIFNSNAVPTTDNGGNLVKSGAGRMVMSGANSFTGNFTLAAGQLDLNSATALGTGPFTITGGTIGNSSGTAITLSTNNVQAWNGDFAFAGQNSLNLGTGAVTLNASRTVTVTTGSLAVGGSITGSSFGLTKAGAGALTLTGSSSYSGGTTLSTGTLVVGNGNALGASTGSLTVNGGLLNLGGTSITVGRLGGSGGQISTSSAAGTATLATSFASGSSTFAGSIVDNGSGKVGLAKSGAYALTLSASNGYTGATSITGGRLEITSGGRINGTSGITINGAGAELKYNSATPLTQPITFTQGILSGTGTIATALTVGTNDIISPGNSPGIQPYAAGLTWAPGGTYQWELNAMSGTPGTNWDLVDVTSGTFSLAGLSTTNTFMLDLITLTGGNVAGPLDSPYVPGSTYSFLIAEFGGSTFTVPVGYSTAAGSDLTGLFSFNLGNWQGAAPAVNDISVKVNSLGTGIELVVVPEPSSLAIAGIGIAAVAWAVNRRRRAGV